MVFIYNSFFGIQPLRHIHPGFCPGPYGCEVELFFFFFNIYFKTHTVWDITFVYLCLPMLFLHILIPTLDTGQNTTEAENIYTNEHIWNFLKKYGICYNFSTNWGWGVF